MFRLSTAVGRSEALLCKFHSVHHAYLTSGSLYKQLFKLQ